MTSADIGGRRRDERGSEGGGVPTFEVKEVRVVEGAGSEAVLPENADTGEEVDDKDASRLKTGRVLGRERSMSASCNRPAR